MTVKVRRGASVTEKVEVGRTDVSQFRIGRGTESRVQARLYPRNEEVIPLGRFEAEMRVCDTFWQETIIQTDWEIRASDGSLTLSGDSSPQYWGRIRNPFFTTRARYPASYSLGDETIVVMTAPQIEKTFETRVSPAEEQDQ